MLPEIGLGVGGASLAAAIRTTDQPCAWATQGSQGQVPVQSVPGRPADAAADEQVDDDGEI